MKASGNYRLMRLRHVATVDFRKSEATHYEDICERYPQLRKLGGNDVVLLRSSGGAQAVFVHGFDAIGETREGVKRVCLHSERARIVQGIGGGWSAKMIADYAEQLGIQLEGMQTLKEEESQRQREHEQVLQEIMGPRAKASTVPASKGKRS